MKPIIYSQTSHQIQLADIDPDALYILEVLQSNGFSAYLVGGGVRDLLLNYKPKDFDISTNALPEEIKAIFSGCFIVGKRFKLAHVRINHKTFEVSTFRKGDNNDDSLIFNDNQWGTEKDDVMRRDFTVNGLFYDFQNETIIDYVGGVKDAKNNHLHCIGDPYIRFKQDPVRMIRLLKFRARFGLQPEQKMLEALSLLKKEILKSSPLRILEEILRMLESGSSVPFLKTLIEHNFLSTLFPHLESVLTDKLLDKIFSYLLEVDKSILNENKRPPKRAFLVTCIIFPIFQKHIQMLYADSPRKTHLGKIHQEAFALTIYLFDPHIKITKKILSDVAEILYMQYLFTPLSKKKPKPERLTKNRNYSSGIKFLRLRAYYEPGLATTFQQWNEHYLAYRKKRDHQRKEKKSRKPKR